ncbi:hypothetical protein [Amycolatopsis cihanbeyliensis]|uniref:Excreted virulence factor EspC (Type VII ESX diderm) n=1 Tax=Amycolatopsis cihanbeyliensis TaxID=1128664 RepID=A0A542CTE0_AMYCI|nr:hypothetical protein [Amycolatopsis cihanbeyliensis]TQI94092.1 hypothetical protein FB471_6245 [Amycolatopsis cihanbeyliensis]
MSGPEVDYGTLDGIASTLRNASTDVDALGNSVPGTPDAGDGTPAVTGILAHLVENASALVLGAAGAGDDVASAKQRYQEQDGVATEDVQRAGGAR